MKKKEEDGNASEVRWNRERMLLSLNVNDVKENVIFVFCAVACTGKESK